MRTISQALAAKLKQELLPEVGDPTANYSMFNDGGVEAEVGEFLFGMVRLIKPKYVLETGTHKGISAAYIASGLKANGFGKLETIEFIEQHFRYSMDMLIKLGLGGYIRCYMQDVATFKPTIKYDLILLDTEPQTRFAELIKFEPYLKEGGYIFIHDLHQHMHQIPNEEHGFAWPYGLLPEAIKSLVNGGFLRPFHFSTPRGLTGFYKVAEKDYSWTISK